MQSLHHDVYVIGPAEAVTGFADRLSRWEPSRTQPVAVPGRLREQQYVLLSVEIQEADVESFRGEYRAALREAGDELIVVDSVEQETPAEFDLRERERLGNEERLGHKAHMTVTT